MAMIPAMTTGMMDFMMSSGLITDIAAMPVPDLAVPYAAPNAEKRTINITNPSLDSSRFNKYYQILDANSLLECFFIS